MMNDIMDIKGFLHSEGRKSEVVRFALVGAFCTLLQYGMYVLFLRAVGVSAVVCDYKLHYQFCRQFPFVKLFYVQK